MCMHVCTCVRISIHTLCSSIHLQLVHTTLLNLGLDLIILLLYSHLRCTEVVKGELTRQLQPSSCGRSVVTHITLQYYVVPPSVDWCCVSVSTTALSLGLVRGSLSNCPWFFTPRLFLLCPTWCPKHMYFIWQALKKCQVRTRTSVLASVCVLACTHMHVSSVRKIFAFLCSFYIGYEQCPTL